MLTLGPRAPSLLPINILTYESKIQESTNERMGCMQVDSVILKS